MVGPSRHNIQGQSRDKCSTYDGAANDPDLQTSADESSDMSDHPKRVVKITERAKCVY
jgi:hypothetical protein